MNRDTKFLKRILANWVHQYKKRVIQMTKRGFSSNGKTLKGWFNIWKFIDIIHHIQREKKQMTILLDAKKASDEIQHVYEKNS